MERHEADGLDRILEQNKKLGKGNGQRGAGATSAILPPPANPMQVACEFVARHCLHRDKTLTLRYWRDGWWRWCGSHWRETDRRSVMALLYCFTEHALYVAEKDVKPWAPTRRKIGDLIEALGAICILADDVDQPCWLDDRLTGTIVGVENGLLDVEERLLPHTPLSSTKPQFPSPMTPPRLRPISGSLSCGRCGWKKRRRRRSTRLRNGLAM